MTEEQIQSLVALGKSLESSPASWSQLSEMEQQFLEMLLMPRPSFAEEQRQWIRQWWLAVDDSDLDAMNAALPPMHRVSAIETIHGEKVVSCDLLSDSKSGQTYAAIRPILETLPLVRRLPEDFPQPEPLE